MESLTSSAAYENVRATDMISDVVQNDRDIDQLLTLNVREYGATAPRPSTDVVSTRAEFLWRRDQNPAGRATIPIIRDTHGDVVGFLWLIPLRIRIRTHDYLGATGANMVITPENRGTFGLLKLVRRFNTILENHDTPLHFSFVSEENYRRLRRQAPQRSFTVPLLVKVLDYARLVESHFTRKWQRSIAGKVGWIVSPLFLRRPLLPRGEDIHVQEVEQFDTDFEEFWTHVQDKYAAITIRDRAFLTWRFTPVAGRRYQILIARLNGEMLGYAVTRCARVRGIDTGLILDLLVLDDARGRDAGERLVTEAEAMFRSKKMALMASLTMPRSAEYRVLGQCGCRNLALLTPRQFRFAFFVRDSYRERFESLSVKDWFVTLAGYESL